MDAVDLLVTVKSIFIVLYNTDSGLWTLWQLSGFHPPYTFRKDLAHITVITMV